MSPRLLKLTKLTDPGRNEDPVFYLAAGSIQTIEQAHPDDAPGSRVITCQNGRHEIYFVRETPEQIETMMEWAIHRDIRYAERERCAKIAEGRAIRWREAAGHDDAPNWTASEIADMWVTVMRLIREG